MRNLRSHWLSPLIALLMSVTFLFAATDVALANTPTDLNGMPMAWHDADVGLPAAVPLLLLDAPIQSVPADAAAPAPDIPQVVAAPVGGTMTKGVLLLLGLVALTIVAVVVVGVLFFLDLTTDFDLFPNN